MSDEEAAIRRLVDTWVDASRTGDAERLAPLMAEGVVFLTAGQPPMRGREEFLRAFRNRPAGIRMDCQYDIQEVQVEGRLAWLWNDLRITVTRPGGEEEIHRSGPALSILRKNDAGEWQIVRDANLLVRTAVPN